MECSRARRALVLGTLAFLGWIGREVPWPGRDEAFDRAYMRRMAAHHEQGIRLALLAAERADERRLARLARLMAAQQIGDNAILAQWWRGWYGGDLPGSAGEDHAMPGMLTPPTCSAPRRRPARLSDASSSLS
jgi:hypothetical protein